MASKEMPTGAGPVPASQPELVTAIDQAICTHGKCKYNLRAELVARQVCLEIDDNARGNSCEFGRWLDNIDADTSVGMSQACERVKDTHAQVRRTAKAVMERIDRGELTSAEMLMSGDFKARFTEMTGALHEWRDSILRESGKPGSEEGHDDPAGKANSRSG